MDHPDIERIQRLGYPSPEYLDWEREEEFERGDADEEKPADGNQQA